MSLNQLTANYTDSEGEQDDNMKDISLSSDEIPVAENKESARGTPASLESRESAANTPKKKVGRLVSYANEDDDDNDDTTFFKDDVEESDEILNSEPMDTGTEDGEEDKSNDGRDLGVKLPLAPTGKCSVQLQGVQRGATKLVPSLQRLNYKDRLKELGISVRRRLLRGYMTEVYKMFSELDDAKEKVANFVNRVKYEEMDWNKKIQNNKAFRNPSIYEKLIHHLGLDEMGSNYPLEMFDPHCWGKESYYDELSRIQKEEMERREKERKEKTKVDIISGTKKPAEEEAKKRKSRFDQAVPGVAVGVMKNSVPPPTLTSVPSGNKTTISAFGSLKKSK